MDQNFKAARDALTSLRDRLTEGNSDDAAVNETADTGLSAIETIELEMRLLRHAHANAMRALMHRLGDPG